jgi:CHAD domain-containing protein
MHPTRLRPADADVWPDIAATIVSGGWTTDPAHTDRLRRTFLDTFDGRLLRRGQVVEIERRRDGPARLRWIDRAGGRPLAEAELPVGLEGSTEAAAPLFAWDLPAGRLADELGPVLDVRALLPFASITTGRRVIGVRDGEEKLIARIVVDDDTLIAADGARRRRRLGRSLRVEPLRGYDKQAGRLTRWLVDQAPLAAVDGAAGGRAGAPSADTLATVLALLDRPPGGIDAGPAADLEPDLRAIDATIIILRRLLATIEANRQGTIDELDTEFLHDLRVAVRRTRSGLKAFHGIFRPAPLARFAPGFRWVQQATGAARDLDVQLLEFADELRKLDPDAAERLRPLRTLLEDKHRAAHRQTNRALRSARFSALLDRWRGFLDEPPAGPDADRPVVDVAAERIWRAYRRVVKPGRQITDASPAEDLHDLRKRGKELRYLLEFFAPVFPKAEVGPLVRELKLLQDNLGAIQDDHVQAAGLRSYADELLALTAAPETLIALGELVAHHERTSHDARIEFAARFAEFDRPANRARFAALFRPADQDGRP